MLSHPVHPCHSIRDASIATHSTGVEPGNVSKAGPGLPYLALPGAGLSLANEKKGAGLATDPHQGEQHRCAPAVSVTNNIALSASTESDSFDNDCSSNSFDLAERGNSLCLFNCLAYTAAMLRVGAMV